MADLKPMPYGPLLPFYLGGGDWVEESAIEGQRSCATLMARAKHLSDVECAAEKWKAKWLSKHLMDAATGKGGLGDIGPTLISREAALQEYDRAKVLERFAYLPHAHEDVS